MKQIYMILKYVSLFLLVFCSVLLVTDSLMITNYSKYSALIGTMAFYLMIISKSLFSILKRQSLDSSKIYSFLKENQKYQREQGIIVFNIVFIHVVLQTYLALGDIELLVYYYISAIIPTILMVYMELTSFRPFKKVSRKWKRYHSYVWVIVPLIFIHIIYMTDEIFKYLIVTVLIFGVALIEVMSGLKKGKRHAIYLSVGLLLSLTQYYQFTKTINTINASKAAVAEQIAQEQVVVEEDTTTEDTIEEVIEEPVVEEISTVYGDGTYEGTGYGRNGPIVVQTTIENDDILDITVISQYEDGRWWYPVESSIPAQIVANDSTEGVSYVAGSTLSSVGLVDAVDNSLENAKL